MRSGRIVLALAFTAGCTITPSPAPPPPPEPVYACGAHAPACGERFLDALASRAIADPLADSPVQTASAVPVIQAVDQAYANEVRTVGGSAITETEFYALYRRYLFNSPSERLLTLAAIGVSHRPMAQAFEGERCWHWFMDHGGREDGKVATQAK
ncbi:MAG TPA: hypothetical protein VEB43_00485 [Anaeromyxobacter sp.]|nr:hypothetical protein [Anaeromyxobacter sp.]